jgi:hypothetical protein
MENALLNSPGTKVGSMVGIEVGRVGITYAFVAVVSSTAVPVGMGRAVRVDVASGEDAGVGVLCEARSQAMRNRNTPKTILTLKRCFILPRFLQ